MATDLGTARGRIIIDSSGVRSGLVAGSGAIDLFSKKALGLGAGLLGGYGIVQGIKSTIGAAADFEQRLSGLKAVSGATGEQMAQLADQALRLGKNTAFSATDAAAAQTELAKAGVSVKDILGGGLQGALALAAAGEIDVGQAATIAANAMNQFKLSGKDLTHVADALATAANQTTTDVGDVGLSLSQGGAAAKAAGLSFDETVTFIEALANASVKGSDAGTSLKAAITQLLAPTTQAKQAIKDAGLALFDQAGNLKDAAGLSLELRDATRDMNRQQKVAFLTTIAGVDGFRTLLALIEAGPRKLAAYEKGLKKQGTAAETAAVKQDNLRGDLEKLQGSIETLQIRAGAAAVGGLRELTQGATDLLDAAAASEDLAAFGEGVLSIGSGAASAVAALEPLGRSVLEVTGALAGATGGFLSSEAGARTLTVAVTGLVSAYASLEAASLATSIARSGPGAFITLATSVRSASDAASLAEATFPKTASAIAGLRGVAAPAGVAIAGLAGTATTGAGTFATLAASAGTVAIPLAGAAVAAGLLAGGVSLLASGAFRGASAAEQLASSVRDVEAAARGASGAVTGLSGAIGTVKQANLDATAASLAVERAQRNYNAAVAQYGPRSLEAREASNQLAQAQFRANAAVRDQADANRGAATAAVNATVKTAELITAIRRGTTSQVDLAKGSRAVAVAFGLPASKGNDLARSLKQIDRAGGDAGDRMNALREFVRKAAAELDTSTKSGRESKKILDQLGNLDTAGINHFGQVFNTALANGAKPADALKKALADIKPPKNVKLDAEDKATAKARNVAKRLEALKPKTVAINANAGNALAALTNVRSELEVLQDKTINVTIVPHHKKGSWTVQETIEALRATPRRQDFEVFFTPRNSKAVENALGNPDTIVAAREALDAKLAAIDQREDARQQGVERRRLQRAVTTAQRELASAKTADKRQSAQRSLADAKAALAEFRIQAVVEGKRAGIGMLQGILDNVTQRRGELESAMSDLGSTIGDALQRGLDAKLAGIDATLKATLADIANSPEAQRVTAIGAEIDSLRSAREARDAQRQRTDLTAAATSAGDVVARRQAALARARTASERQAAQALLDKAIADQQTADQALADFEEDQRLAALEKERTDLETGLQQRRDAAQQAADDARAAAQAEYDAQVAQTQRLLGDLQERFRSGEITAKQFQARLTAILGDPRIAAALDASGETLGLSFTRGLERTKAELRRVSKELAAIPASYLKLNSPAETGPLASDPAGWGQTLVNDMAAGMLSRRNIAAQASAAIAGAIAVNSRATAAAAQPTGVPAGAGVNIERVEFPVQAPLENPREAAAGLYWELANGGIY